jgi:fatty-acyl-CoA synthase
MDTRHAIDEARQQTLEAIPRRTAQRFPDKEGIVDGEVRLTFAELDDRIDRVCAALLAEGLAQGDTLALLAHNCWQYPVLAFATARLGIVLVPINFMLGAEEIAYILDHSRSDALVAEDGLVPAAAAAIARTSGRVRLRATIRLQGTPTPYGWVDVETWMEHERAPLPDVHLADDEPLRLMYTSGTESRPKGVMLSSRSLMWQYLSCIVDGEMSSSDVEVHPMPLYHCAQLDVFLSPDIYLGATSVIVRSAEPRQLLRTIERERATKLFSPPTTWIDLLRSPAFDDTDLSSLRKGYYGASAMPVEVLKEMGRRLPDVRFWNFYGQTEMAPLATSSPPEDQLTYPGSAGRPNLHVETRIHDPDDRPVPTGEVGEIVHRSPHLMVGYFDDEERTAEAFRGGWFHTGDLGYVDEGGRLYVVDRKKDMIKTGGENVASREVEEVLYAHEGVSEVAVFGLPHPRWVESVTAAVVLRDGAHTTVDDLIAHCREHLAGYKTPKQIFLVGELPRNPSGKLLKRQLRDRYADAAATTTSDRPASDTEERA